MLQTKILLAYFSWTGNTRKIAQTLQRETSPFAEVDLVEIQPTKPRGYWRWLLLSFIPGSRVPINPCIVDLAGYDAFILGLPKWTFSCPPINTYLHDLKNPDGKTAAVFLLYGGFGEKGYLAALVKRMQQRGLNIKATLTVKRSEIDLPRTLEALRSFRDECLGGIQRR